MFVVGSFLSACNIYIFFLIQKHGGDFIKKMIISYLYINIKNNNMALKPDTTGF